MAKAFPDHPFLRGYYAPIHMECDADHLPVTGEIPKELCGTLYRNGPNPQFAPRGFYHWFAGDGMLHAFHVENGRVSYRNRWVRTPKWELENKAGEALIGAFGNPMWTDQKHWGFDSTIANTNVVWHGDRLLALEEAHAPFEVDAKTLMPKGYRDWDGKVGKFTAHPKIDPRTGDMVAFAYSAAGRFTPEIDIIVVGADGTLKRKERFAAPYSSMIHDFVVTERWIILPVFPLTGSMERAMKGQPAFAWEPDKGTHVALIPRDGTVADVKWITGDACYVFHPLNAFDAEGGKIVCDMMKYPVAPLFPLPDGSMPTKHSPKATLVRWTFDPDGTSNSYREEALDDHPGEFPRFDERFACLPNRHGYFQAGVPTESNAEREKRAGLAHIDLATRKVVHWQPPNGDYCGEPIFVARGDTAAEGDGWLVTTIYRAAENRSDLAVFDATGVDKGPVALAHLSHRVPAGFHGNWRPGSL